MLQIPFKAPVVRAITPICRAALRVGLTPNMVTVLGGLGVTISALWFFPRGDLFIGSLVVSFFALSDLFDGTMARISDRGASKWGAVLDATIDRISDSAIVIGILIYLIDLNDRLIPVVLVALISGLLVSYIKAKAESLGIECEGGLAERVERVMIATISIGLAGLSVPYALTSGMFILALASCYTVLQRMVIVYHGSNRSADA